jgi:AhpD family alkylhydroperoxidase
MGDRVRTVALSETCPADREVYTGIFGDGVDPVANAGTRTGDGPGPNGITGDTWTTWANVPGLPAAFVGVVNVLVHDKSALDPQLRELAIIRTAIDCETKLCYSQHVKMARVRGVPEAKIGAVKAWATSDLFGPSERAVLATTDELLGRNVIEDETFTRLKEHLTDQAIVELVFLIGLYKMQTIFMRGLKIEYENDTVVDISEV